MANFVFTPAIETLLGIDWPNADVRVILLDNTSTAHAERDAETIDGITTLGEVSGTGYERKALASKTQTLDTANDLVKLSCGEITYGGIDAGSIYALILYLHVNDDTDSIPLMHFDNSFTVTAAAPAVSGATTIYVDPLPDRILVGSVLTFPNAVLATLTATANAGDRSLSVQSLADSIALAAKSQSPAEGMPIPTSGDLLTVTLPENLLVIANR